MRGVKIIHEYGQNFTVTFEREPGEPGTWDQPPGDHETEIIEILNGNGYDVTEKIRGSNLWDQFLEVVDDIPTVDLR